MANRFRDVEAALKDLKQKFRAGEISQRKFVDSLKQLRIKDTDGRFWMIGAQSGKWYFFDDKDWVQANPPSLEEKKAICIYCGFENDLEDQVCARCGMGFKEGEKEKLCPRCGYALKSSDEPCPRCASEEKKLIADDEVFSEEAFPDKKGEIHILRSIQPLSFLLFWGTAGLFTGIILGLLLGATEFFPSAVAVLPSFFREIQGKIVGGIIFTALGGVIGFLAFSASGYLLAVLTNGILSLVGGIKVRLERLSGKGPTAES